jgi:hypothetical protein
VDLVAQEFPVSHPHDHMGLLPQRNQRTICPGHVMIISLGAVVGMHSEKVAIISRMGPAMGGPWEGHMLQMWANSAPVHHEDRNGNISKRISLEHLSLQQTSMAISHVYTEKH